MIRIFRQERIEHRLVDARRIDAPLDADLLDQPGEPERRAEPPGELIASATARARGQAKARSSCLATFASVMPGRSGVENPITPVSRTTGTTGMSPRNRRGRTGRRKSAVRS